MRAGLGSCALVLALGSLLAGCGTAPQTRLHSLMPAAAGAAAAIVVTTPEPQPWELLSVAVPAQVDQPQWLIRRADDSLVALEFERWVAPLTDEIRGALMQHIGAALVSAPLRPSAVGARFRISVDVTRLDAAIGRASRWEAAWALQRMGAAMPALRCQGQFEQPAMGGLAALAVAHRANVAKLGEVLAADLRRVAALPEGARAGCVAP